MTLSKYQIKALKHDISLIRKSFDDFCVTSIGTIESDPDGLVWIHWINKLKTGQYDSCHLGSSDIQINLNHSGKIEKTLILMTKFDAKKLIMAMDGFIANEDESLLPEKIGNLLAEGEQFISFFSQEANEKYLTHPPENGLEHISAFLRSLFNYIDRFITFVRSKEKTCAETYTYGAQTLIGRNHFLNPPETELGSALKDFENAYKKFQEHGYSNTQNHELV